MITINNVSKKHHFPLIDFKFQNSGSATAFIWEFRINVFSVKIDLSPVLNFRYEVTSNNGNSSKSSKGDLIIFVKNNGYGAATCCNIRIEHLILNEYFTTDKRHFTITILPGEEKKLCILECKHLQNANIHAKTKQIDNITAEWDCITEEQKSVSNKQFVVNEIGDRNVLFIKNGRFEFDFNIFMACMRPPSEIYCVLIDHFKGKHVRSYPMSREIKPGDIDRFHIMIGTSRSAFIELDFEFKIDKDDTVKSKPFMIEIFNPMNSSPYDMYIDGEVLQAEIENLKAGREQNEWNSHRINQRYKNLKNSKDYPFWNNKALDNLDY